MCSYTFLPYALFIKIDLHANIETGSVFHKLSINSGLLYGSKTYFGLLKLETMSVPLMAGYPLNVPLSEIATSI